MTARRTLSWYGTLTRCGAASQPLPTPIVLNAGGDVPPPAGLTTPDTHRVHAWHVPGLDDSPFRSPLLWAGYYFLKLLRCFSSPGSLPANAGSHTNSVRGCPIRRR